MPGITLNSGYAGSPEFPGDDSARPGTLEEREEKVVGLYHGIGLANTYTLEEIAE
jgi:hypothetical protein